MGTQFISLEVNASWQVFSLGTVIYSCKSYRTIGYFSLLLPLFHFSKIEHTFVFSVGKHLFLLGLFLFLCLCLSSPSSISPSLSLSIFSTLFCLPSLGQALEFSQIWIQVSSTTFVSAEQITYLLWASHHPRDCAWSPMILVTNLQGELYPTFPPSMPLQLDGELLRTGSYVSLPSILPPSPVPLPQALLPGAAQAESWWPLCLLCQLPYPTSRLSPSPVDFSLSFLYPMCFSLTPRLAISQIF